MGSHACARIPSSLNYNIHNNFRPACLVTLTGLAYQLKLPRQYKFSLRLAVEIPYLRLWSPNCPHFEAKMSRYDLRMGKWRQFVRKWWNPPSWTGWIRANESYDEPTVHSVEHRWKCSSTEGKQNVAWSTSMTLVVLIPKRTQLDVSMR